MKQRPVGLTVFAVINFILGVSSLFNLVRVLIFWESTPYSSLPPHLKAFSFVGPIFILVMSILSGIGFIKMGYRLGFIGGVIFSVGTLTIILTGNILYRFYWFSHHIPIVAYSVVLLLFLTMKYRRTFESETADAEQVVGESC